MFDFATLGHIRIFAVLRAMELPLTLIALILLLYTDLCTDFVYTGDVVATSDLRAGIRQGCPLSSTIFALACDVRWYLASPAFTSTCIFLYADDMAAAMRDAFHALPFIIRALHHLAARVRSFFEACKAHRPSTLGRRLLRPAQLHRQLARLLGGRGSDERNIPRRRLWRACCRDSMAHCRSPAHTSLTRQSQCRCIDFHAHRVTQRTCHEHVTVPRCISPLLPGCSGYARAARRWCSTHLGMRFRTTHCFPSETSGFAQSCWIFLSFV